MSNLCTSGVGYNIYVLTLVFVTRTRAKPRYNCTNEVNSYLQFSTRDSRKRAI